MRIINLKKFISFLLVFTLVFCCAVQACASKPDIKGNNEYKVAVRGDLGTENAGKTVSVMLLSDKTDMSSIKAEDILYLNDARADENGKYGLDFSSSRISYTDGKANCKIYIRQGSEDVTNSLIYASATERDMCFYDLKLYDELGQKKARLVVDNPFNVKVNVTMFVASYDSNGILIDVQKRVQSVDKEQNTFTINHTCTSKTEKVKALVWADIINAVPLVKGVEKNNDIVTEHKNVLIIGNSYSVDSTRYVHDMANSLGADIDVYLIQQGGRSVYELWANRENSSYYMVQKNGSSISARSLDTLLDEFDFDVIAMQNYWGSSSGILHYANDTYNCSKTDAYKNMALYLHQKQPDAEIMINSVWSNENGYNTTADIENAAKASEFFGVEKGNYVQRYFYNQVERFNGQAAFDSGEAINDDKTPLRQFPVGYAIQIAREFEKDGKLPYFTTTDDTVKSFADMQNGDLCPISESDALNNRLRLNRDGYHLSYAGRYLAGLVWTEILTGVSAENIDYVPNPEQIICGYQSVSSDDTSTTETIAVSFNELTSDQISDLKKIAHSAVKQYYDYGCRTLDKTAMKLTID